VPELFTLGGWLAGAGLALRLMGLYAPNLRRSGSSCFLGPNGRARLAMRASLSGSARPAEKRQKRRLSAIAWCYA